MDKWILFGCLTQLFFVVVGAFILNRKWRPAMLAAGTITAELQSERAYSSDLAERVKKLDAELTQERGDRIYWERLCRNFEDEVMKIATGKS